MEDIDYLAVEKIPALNVASSNYLYAPGTLLKLATHQPPQPFGDSVYKPPFNRDPLNDEQKILKTRSPRDHVFMRLPRERTDDSILPDYATKYFAVRDEATIRITDTLQSYDGVGAQVVICQVENMPKTYWTEMGCRDRPKQVVAKIFDPLFYPKQHDLAPWVRLDIVSMADKDYAHEAASYMELHDLRKTRPMIRDFTPSFYGAWTVIHQNQGYGKSDTVPSEDDSNPGFERHVRIVLMEHIDGITIGDACGRQYEDEFPILVPPTVFELEKKRLAVFARLLRGLTALEHAGVFPEDRDPWNFILVDEDQRNLKSKNPLQQLSSTRVVMVDYGRTEITRYTTQGKDVFEKFPRPLHPITRFIPDALDAFAGWFPREWLDDPNPFYEWAKKAFYMDDYTWHTQANEIIERGDEQTEAAGMATSAVDSATPCLLILQLSMPLV